MFIFKSVRDSSMINHIARQIFPSNSKFLIGAYEDAVSSMPHGYLFLDLRPGSNDKYRVRSNILTKKPAVYTQ